LSKRYLIGRKSVAKGDILLDHDTISGSHAYFYKNGNEYYLEDNHSTNGTMVNGTKITQSKITHNDSIYFGEYQSSLNELITLSKINQQKPIIQKSQEKQSTPKQKCPECGMVIEKNSTCKFCK
jgi:pSer/pThr/pTyr-binding forkhead associated (FHA) protein